MLLLPSRPARAAFVVSVLGADGRVTWRALRRPRCPLFSGVEWILPPSQPPIPPAHPLLLCIDLALSRRDRDLSDLQSLSGALPEYRPPVAVDIAEHGDQLAVNEQGDGPTHRGSRRLAYRLHVDHFAAVDGTRTVRYSSLPRRPANNLRSILADRTPSRSITSTTRVHMQTPGILLHVRVVFGGVRSETRLRRAMDEFACRRCSHRLEGARQTPLPATPDEKKPPRSGGFFQRTRRRRVRVAPTGFEPALPP